MSKPHYGTVKELTTRFENIWTSLNAKGELSLQTEGKKKQFIAKASKAQRGKHSGEKVILFLQEKNGERYESARAYDCCWGYHTNCYGTGTRIGMYCKSLENALKL
jgi:hypothetical protein